jgi:hypothetical protein
MTKIALTDPCCHMCGKSLKKEKEVYADPADGDPTTQEDPKLYCGECVDSGCVGMPKQ